MQKRFVVVLAAAITMAMSATSFASVANDEVTSVKLKEADGTSGQNTNSGSGVKTGHIQDGAVTAAKIADGAVTDAKITGPISAAKISTSGLNADFLDGMHAIDFSPAVHSHDQSQVTGLNAALAGKADVGHNHDTLYQRKISKVAIVAPADGDYTSPVAAMNALSTWCGTPSASNRCLVRIQPGIYDLAGGALLTQPYVDVEGSGENATVIKSGTAVVQSADNVEIRFLTVESTGGASSSSAIYVAGSSKLTHVTARAAGGQSSNIGIDIRYGSPVLTDITVDLQGEFATNWGIISGTNNGNTVTMKNVLISVGNGNFNYGIGGYSGKTILNNVSTTVYPGPNTPSMPGNSYGIWSSGGTISIANSYITAVSFGMSTSVPTSIQNSTIKGNDYSFWATSGVDAKLAATQLDGTIYPQTAGLKCISVYDANYSPVTCP